MTGVRVAPEDSGRVTEYVDTRVTTASPEAGVVEPDAVYVGWNTLVSHRAVRALTVAPRSRHVWMATWGGVLSWNQREELLYRRYSSEHGVLGAALCICLDEHEHPRVGHAEGGLSYFDGHRWRVYPHLPMEPIRALASVSNPAGVWVAASRTIYHLASVARPPTPVVTDHEGCVDAEVILEDEDALLVGNRWGIFRIQQHVDPVPIAPGEISHCTALARSGDGRVWVGTTDGVYVLSRGRARAAPNGGPTGRVLGIAAGREVVWVLTGDGLTQLRGDSWVPVVDDRERPTAVRAIATGTDENYLWLGTDELLAGVWCNGNETRWDSNVLTSHAEDPLSNLGRCAAASASDEMVWIGTAGGVVAGTRGRVWTRDGDVGDVRAACVAASGDPGDRRTTLWMLTWPHGIRRFDGPDWIAAPAPQPPGLPKALAVGADGSAYVVSGETLWRINGEYVTPVASHVPATAGCLAQGPEETWWIGTTRGLHRLAGAGWELFGAQPGLDQAEVYALVRIDGTLWAATASGLWAHEGGGWTEHPAATTASARRAVTLAPSDSREAIWLARDDGVVRYEPGRGITKGPYDVTNSGVCSRRIVAVAECAGTLWVATKGGISRFTWSEEEERL
jgi:hypothetical protein